MPRCDFNKVAMQLVNLNFLHIVKTPFLKGCLCCSTFDLRHSALGPQIIARPGTILLFNFEVVITLKL